MPKAPSKTQVTLSLDRDVAELLIQLAGSSRKQGELVNELVRERARGGAVLQRIAELERELAQLRAAVLNPLPPAE